VTASQPSPLERLPKSSLLERLRCMISPQLL
jgi:hypothetical protein